MKELVLERILELEKSLSNMVRNCKRNREGDVSGVSVITKSRYEANLNTYLLNIELYNHFSSEKRELRYGTLREMMVH